MSATTSNERRASELEREGEEIRASLDRTLDEIQQRFSSGELLDRSMEFLRNNGLDLLREAGETVRRNPVPVVLTAAGLVWLTASVASSRSTGRSGSDGRDLTHYRSQARASDRSGDGGDYWEGSTHGSTTYESTTYESTEGRMRHAAHRMRGKVASSMGGVKGQAQDVTGRVKSRLSSSMQSMQARGHQAGSNLANMVRENPVALGALALAAGALLGAALPMTRSEKRWVGPVHDRTMARAKEVGQREYENIRQKVSSRARGRSKSAEPHTTESGNGAQATSTQAASNGSGPQAPGV
jgi:ElaB/YqjD/DUF883 family membrane-anchored ribosome-binding protein